MKFDEIEIAEDSEANKGCRDELKMEQKITFIYHSTALAFPFVVAHKMISNGLSHCFTQLQTSCHLINP